MISRLHIGHSYITHSFLLKGGEPTMYIVGDDQATSCRTYMYFLV